jgi:hypothetical protein
VRRKDCEGTPTTAVTPACRHEPRARLRRRRYEPSSAQSAGAPADAGRSKVPVQGRNLSGQRLVALRQALMGQLDGHFRDGDRTSDACTLQYRRGFPRQRAQLLTRVRRCGHDQWTPRSGSPRQSARLHLEEPHPPRPHRRPQPLLTTGHRSRARWQTTTLLRARAR